MTCSVVYSVDDGINTLIFTVSNNGNNVCSHPINSLATH